MLNAHYCTSDEKKYFHNMTSHLPTNGTNQLYGNINPFKIQDQTKKLVERSNQEAHNNTQQQATSNKQRNLPFIKILLIRSAFHLPINLKLHSKRTTYHETANSLDSEICELILPVQHADDCSHFLSFFFNPCP